MAKNFGKVNDKTFENVGKVSEEKAQVITVKMIPNEKLNDYPNNREDVSDTADLENSIRQVGFIDPIEVTSFEQPDGEYMIVSGHRRRKAGTKVNMTMFPCIIKHFNSIAEVENYVLLANSQRDSAKDPLLFCKRYKMHEEYLKSINFNGNIRDEVARRLGISKSHADRYNTMNKVILPVWDMVRDDVVGMSSVLPMASHSENEQAEIYDIMQEALNNDITLTRDTVKHIVSGYRSGKKTWSEIIEIMRDSVLPLGVFEDEGEQTSSTISEIRNETPEVKEGSDDEQLPGQKTFEDFEQKKEKTSEQSDEAKQAKEIVRLIKKLNNAFDNEYSFSEKDEAAEALLNMGNAFTTVIEQMYDIAKTHNIETIYDSVVEKMKLKIEDFQ